jgi:capsular polysaccharide biosynthesis protein
MEKNTLEEAGSRIRMSSSYNWTLVLVDEDSDVEAVLQWVRDAAQTNRMFTDRYIIQIADSSDLYSRWEHSQVRSPGSLIVTRGFKGVGTLYEYLIRQPRPRCVADMTRSSPTFKRRVAKNIPFLVKDGGQFIVSELAAYKGEGSPTEAGAAETLLSAFSANYSSSPARRNSDIGKLGRSFDSLSVSDDLLEFSRGRQYLSKLRDSEATDVLESRYGAQWGEVKQRQPAHEFSSLCSLTTNRNKERFPHTFNIPETNLRMYQGAVSYYGQVLTYGDYVLPDSYRHGYQENLTNKHLTNVSQSMVEFPAAVSTRRAQGRYFYIDSEHPDHFGHVMTESFSRLAVFMRLRREIPDLGVALSTKKPNRIPGWLNDILDILEVPASRRIIINPGNSITFDELYATTPLLSQPKWIDPAITDLWQLIVERVVDAGTRMQRPIFSTRLPGENRTCKNFRQVEELFESSGYEVLLAETMPFADQVRRFASAPAVAGFAGSNLFQMMFSPAGKRIVVAGDAYDAINEYMISAVDANSIHYSFHNSDLQQPSKGWSWSAFSSNFVFDLKNDPELIDLVNS